MKHYPNIFIIVFISFFIISCEKENLDGQIALKACSFNIRFDNPNDGFNNWENRRKNVVNFLGVEKADVIGLQEVLAGQLEYIEKRLLGYTRVGVGRDDGIAAGEFAPVFFRSDRFKLLDSGTFWLSETPQTPSIGWDALINRICTYAFLLDMENDERIHVYNTHLSHVGSEARLKSAELIMDRISQQSSGAHVILTGDFNAEPGSSPYNEIVNGGLIDSYQSELKLGPVGTYNGFRLTGLHDRRIDFIFFDGFQASYYVTHSMVIDNQYLSDHFPIIVLLEYHPLN